MRASDRAYTALREEILDGDLPAGTVLAEVEQSVRLGVSRTPLREALTRLASESLVSGHSGRGVVVTDVSIERVKELFEVREALEEQAARLAARRRDRSVFERLQREFRTAHELLGTDEGLREYYGLVAQLDAAIDDASGNAFLVSTLAGVRTHIARIRRLSHDNPERLREAAREHLAIIDAIVDGEEALAAHATQLHLYRSLKNITNENGSHETAPRTRL
ncbi:MAG: GntR family transcriptional regulator [Microbacteriaceae bacterium]|jgi:DNA-binding GntR family transcriptional regulator|nr:GntR family transcriptional regulator [Microbacteriaceae bacterium]